MSIDLHPHLVGRLVELRPLRHDDWPALHAVASDPLIWEQHPAKDRWKDDIFRAFFDDAMSLNDPGDAVKYASGCAFAVLDSSTGRTIGSTRFANFVPQVEVEIGWTFLARECWGGRHNGDMKRLLLEFAFQHVPCVYFLIGPDNLRSQRAVEKIGAVRKGLFDRPDVHARHPSTPSVRFEIVRPSASRA